MGTHEQFANYSVFITRCTWENCGTLPGRADLIYCFVETCSCAHMSKIPSLLVTYYLMPDFRVWESCCNVVAKYQAGTLHVNGWQHVEDGLEAVIQNMRTDEEAHAEDTAVDTRTGKSVKKRKATSKSARSPENIVQELDKKWKSFSWLNGRHQFQRCFVSVRLTQCIISVRFIPLTLSVKLN